MSLWYVYIVEAENGAWYTGITTDVHRRFLEHRANQRRQAKFFRTSPARRLIAWQACGSKQDATQSEYRIKQLNKPQKRRWVVNLLISGNSC